MKLLHAAAALCILAAAPAAHALDLHEERSSPFDLAVRGAVAGVPEGATRYARWSDLRALPTSRISVNGEFIKGVNVVTVVFLSDLWKALPVSADADTVLATCTDGYASGYTSGFISTYKPFLVLEIDGKGPKDWPPPGQTFNPAPFVITVAPELYAGAPTFLDIEHKKPWSVSTVSFARFSDTYKGIYSGRWASLGPEAAAGRQIWINSCASCHSGPKNTFGGTRSERPFPIIAAYAGSAPALFKKYVHNPKDVVASAAMEAHPWYTEKQLSDLIAFITSGQQLD